MTSIRGTSRISVDNTYGPGAMLLDFVPFGEAPTSFPCGLNGNVFPVGN